MIRKIHILLVILFLSAISSFSLQTPVSANERARDYYTKYFSQLVAGLKMLQSDIKKDQPTTTLQRQFLEARISYKKIELFIEYYFELDVHRINGPPLETIEEEDPTAIREPLGFQVIEPFLFPRYNSSTKKEVLAYLEKLISISEGLSNNSSLFNPGNYIMDALMEELYRIVALGITGFDSPVAQYSIPEAAAALNSIREILVIYEPEIPRPVQGDYKKIIRLIHQSQTYLHRQKNFNSLNRMELISLYINPAGRLLGNIKSMNAFSNSPIRSGSVEKTTGLFDIENLRISRFLGDDILTPEKIELGKALFFDPALSSNGKRSCASCHQPDKAFTDGLPKAASLDEHGNLTRNTPTLWNASLQKNLFHDSRKSSLDDLIREVLGNEKEMNSGAEAATGKLSTRADYRELLKRAYPGRDSLLTTRLMINAMAMYLHTLISFNSRFDQHIRGERKTLTAREINGFNLFMGKARCATCHFAPLFNGSKPTLYLYQESEVIGVPARANTKQITLDPDQGRFTVTNKEFHRFSFKTPGIRNIELTSPYMHNGVFKSLEEVMDFYNKGGGKSLGIAPPNQSLPFQKLNLQKEEIKDLIAFMRSLTDKSGSSFNKVFN